MNNELREKIAIIIKLAIGRETPNKEYIPRISKIEATDQILALISKSCKVKDKPKLLSDEDIMKLSKDWASVSHSGNEFIPFLRYVCQAQLDADIKHYGGK